MLTFSTINTTVCWHFMTFVLLRCSCSSIKHSSTQTLSLRAGTTPAAAAGGTNSVQVSHIKGELIMWRSNSVCPTRLLSEAKQRQDEGRRRPRPPRVAQITEGWRRRGRSLKHVEYINTEYVQLMRLFTLCISEVKGVSPPPATATVRTAPYKISNK